MDTKELEKTQLEQKEKKERGLKRLPDGRWRVSWMYQGRYKRVKVRTKGEARAILDKVHTEIREGRYLDVKKKIETPFHEAVTRFLRWSLSSNRRSTYLLDELCSKTWLSFAPFKGKTLVQISGDDVEKYKQSLQNVEVKNGTRNSGKPLASRTVDMRIARLKRLFSLCLEWGLCDRNPASKVKLLRKDNKRVRYLSESEEAKLMEAACPALRKVIQFALHTGMRRGEILGLKWSDIHLQTPVIVIPATRAKGKKERVIPLNKVVLSILYSLPRPSDRDALVFANKNGGTWDRMRKLWEKAIKSSGIKDFRFHDTRHTYASRMVSKGIDLAVIKELLGHSDYETTLRYAHLTPERLKEAVAVLEPLDTN